MGRKKFNYGSVGRNHGDNMPPLLKPLPKTIKKKIQSIVFEFSADAVGSLAL
jgi:hypothetical protein